MCINLELRRSRGGEKGGGYERRKEEADCANEEGLEIRQQSSTSISQMPDKKIESRFEKQIKRSKMERFTLAAVSCYF